MTCARRPAGARKPASWTGSRPASDPRPGRRCARFFALLPALALLLGALLLFPAAPAWAQPAAPTNVTFTPGNAKIVATWTATTSPSSIAFGYWLHYTSASVADVPNSAGIGSSGLTHAQAWKGTGSLISGRATTTYTISGLPNGTKFRVRLRTAGVSNSAWVYGTATPALPVTPAGVDVRKHPTVTTSLSVRWDRVAGATAYGVRWRTKGPPAGSWSSNTTINKALGTLGRPFNITGLVSGTEYEVQVRSTVGSDHSAWSTAVSATPGADAGTVWSAIFTPPSTATGMGCISKTQCDSALSNNSIPVGSSTFNIRYLDYRSAHTGQVNLRMQQASTAALGALNFCSGSVSVPMNDTGTYVIDRRENIRMEWTSGVPVEVRIGNNCAIEFPPNAPRNIRVQSLISGTLEVTWVGPLVHAPTRFVLEYKEQSAPDAPATQANDPSTGWTLRVTAPEFALTTRRQISNLENGRTYDVRVRSENNAGNSDWVVGQGTPAGPPTAPSGLDVGAVDGALALSWTAPSGDVASYDVHYTSAAPGTAADDAAVQTGASPSPAAGWVDAGHSGTAAVQTIPSLDNGTLYRVRVARGERPGRRRVGARHGHAVRGRPARQRARARRLHVRRYVAGPFR